MRKSVAHTQHFLLNNAFCVQQFFMIAQYILIIQNNSAVTLKTKKSEFLEFHFKFYRKI